MASSVELLNEEIMSQRKLLTKYHIELNELTQNLKRENQNRRAAKVRGCNSNCSLLMAAECTQQRHRRLTTAELSTSTASMPKPWDRAA